MVRRPSDKVVRPTNPAQRELLDPAAPMSPEEAAALERIKSILLADGGRDISQYKDRYLRRRLNVRVRATKLPSYAAYVRLLEREPRELPILLDKLTINVTEFFRNPQVWRVVSTVVLPALFADRPEGSMIRVWSAGCANGQEAYSILFTLIEYLDQHPGKWKIVIRGTDVDRASLQTARAGCYPTATLRGATPEVVARYFEDAPDPQGEARPHVRVRKEFRDRVTFQYHDLVSDRPQRYFDLILCRNMLIYLSKAQQEHVLRSLHAALVSRGFLVLGKTESMAVALRPAFQLVDVAERVYQRLDIPPT